MAPERTMRIMKYAIIVSCLLFVVVAIKIPSKATHPPGQPLELIVILLALVNIALGFAARPFLSRVAPANANRTGSGAALKQWMSGNILSLALIESCALFAVVLHMLGSGAKVAGLLFGCALLALFVWNPGTPPEPRDTGQISQ